MSKSERFRFGKIDLPESELPTPEEVYESIDDRFRVRTTKKFEEEEEPVELMETGMSKYLNDGGDSYSFCHFFYVSDKEDNILARNGNELEERRSEQVVRPRVFYFENGQFAYESVQGLVKHWVPRFIGSITETEVQGEYTFDEFSQETMRDFYRTRDHISVFRFAAPEEEDFSPDTPLARALSELTENVASQELSSGQSRQNLKGVEIVEEAAKEMRVEKLHGTRDDGYTMNILASGVFVPVWSEANWGSGSKLERQADTISQIIVPYLQKLEQNRNR